MKLNLKDNLKGRILLTIMYFCEIIDMSIYFMTFSLVVSDLEAGGEIVVERLEEHPYIISDESTCRLLLLRAC